VSAAILSARQANVSDDAYQSPTGNERSKAMPPNAVELVHEPIVIGDGPKLVGALVVLLESPIGRRSHHQVKAAVGDPVKIPRVSDRQVIAWLHKAIS